MHHRLLTLAMVGALAATTACQPQTPTQGPVTPVQPAATEAPVAASARVEGLVKAPVSIIAAGGGNIISTGGGNIISTGGGNIISTGGGNIIAPGGGNIIAPGGGNVIQGGIGQIIAAGGGNIIAAGGGNIISTGGGNIIAPGGGNIIAAGGGNYELLQAVRQSPLAGAMVFLTDVKGQILNIPPVLTDAQGRYELREIPRGLTFLVVVQVKVKGKQALLQASAGGDASLTTIATARDDSNRADVSLATTLTTATIYRGAARGVKAELGEHMGDTFQRLSEQFDETIESDVDERLINADALLEGEALVENVDQIVEEHPMLQETIKEVQADLVAPTPPPASTPAPIASRVPTPAPTPAGVAVIIPSRIDGTIRVKPGVVRDTTASESISL